MHTKHTSLRPLAVLLLTLCCTAPARGETVEPSAGVFTFTGRGWGHAVGMGQWGAKGLADKGWDEVRILARFYTGTTLGRRAGPVDGGAADQIRVGLFQNAGIERFTGNGRFDIVLNGSVVASAAAGEAWTIRPTSDGRFLVVRPDGSSHGVYGDTSNGLYVRFAEYGTVLSLPDVGYRYARGVIELNVHRPVDVFALRGVLTMNFEQYLYGLGEVPSSWPVAALRAQAIAGRTYALEKVNRLGQHRAGCNCGIDSTVADQAYVGYEKEAGSSGARWVQAVDATAGTVVLYNGAPIQAYYSSSTGGLSEDVDKQWGGSVIQYLRAVCDPGDWAGGGNPNANWTTTMDEPTLRSRLSGGGYDVGVVQRIEYLDPRGASGRVIGVVSSTRGGVRVSGTGGTARLGGDRFRSLLGLRSNLLGPLLYGGIRERWDALDCGPKVPASNEYDWRDLSGALRGRAQNFAIGRLYWNRANGAVFWNYGGILEKYDILRRGSIDLGLPTTDEIGVRGGRAVYFERGRIYWTPSAWANATWGGIMEAYLKLGGPDSYLGLPVQDETDAPGGRMSRFQGGVLLWNRANGAVHPLYGGVHERWDQLGGSPGQPSNDEHDWKSVAGKVVGRAQDFINGNGRLIWNGANAHVSWNYGGILEKFDALRRIGWEIGLPVTDEIDVAGGRAVYYESGRIYWSPSTSAHVVIGGILEKYLSTGGPGGRLALPMSDEYDWNGRRRSDFQGGYIVWDAQNGAVVTYR
jgi:SpoIID/LytB domain protein